MTLTELEVVNAFFGFCVSMGNTWPSTLLPLGYSVVGVEKEIATPANGSNQRVVPDIICASPLVNHALCVDAKSATVHEDQERGYETLRPRTLVTQGIVPPEINAAEFTNDCLLVTARANAGILQHRLTEISVVLPILAADETGFDLTSGSLTQQQLHGIFSEGIRLDGHRWPNHFVPFNSKSPNSVVAPHVIRALIQLLRTKSEFQIHDIAMIAVPHWKLCGSQEQNEIRKKIREILWQAEQTELKHDFVKPGKQQKWRARGRRSDNPQYLEALQDRASQFVARIQSGATYKEGQQIMIPESAFPEEDGDKPRAK